MNAAARTSASTTTAASALDIRCQAGTYVVRLHTAGSPVTPAYRVEVTSGSGFVVDDLTRPYPTEDAARAAARAITRTLRGLARLATQPAAA